jgi:hypothetical protein
MNLLADSIPPEPRGYCPRLKARHITIEIQPVDAFHFQHDMATDYFGDVLRYHALGLRVS